MVSTGIYSLLPLARRITKKIENIIREEMDAIGCQEILMPVVLPRELWEESGRYESVGAELLRFKDRNDKDMMLGMTHEEAVVALVRTEINSYKKLPAIVYQLQTKYRDEARPRAGLIRVREFTMKDAYSFHESQESLEEFYNQCHEAYLRIFKRVGLHDLVSIQADSGMMGGSGSHEYMAIAECGEDTLFCSPDGSYQANREIAKSPFKISTEAPLPLEKVHTPEQKTIEALATFLKVSQENTGKAVFFKGGDGKLIFVVIRGDLEVNETKLKNYLKDKDLTHATDAEISAVGAVPGYASPMNINAKNVRIIIDPTAAKTTNLVVGANEVDYHYKNFNFDRDMAELRDQCEIVDIATVREGDPCPLTGEPLIMRRGIEVGNIFQLGTRYSEPMNCNFLDQNGKSKPMVMGSYGIGVERTMASVIEQCNDEHGPVWPLSIAPFQVHICALNYNKEDVHKAAEALYEELVEAGVEVLLDDRNEKAGFAFNDADLIGVPLRVIVSPKTLADSQLEFKSRDGKISERVGIDQAKTFVLESLAKLKGAV